VSLIADIARTNDNTNNTLSLSETEVTRAETTVSTDLNESRITADLKPLESDIITNEQSDEWEIVQMRVTAYCPCEQCCGQYSDGVTACGHKIRPGDTFVAADGRYAFGTEMLIPGYSNSQPVQVLDRGGAIKGNKLDVFFNSHEEALKWGVRQLDVRLRGK
jgi:3D (Asp-Asp-Asp) domain-containing protein